MKLSIMALAAMISITSLLSCSGKKYTKYQCPMKCEREKTYDKPGKCPVCEMDLEGVK